MNRLFKKKKGAVASEEMAINITSMADIFTIILVFLLKSFATSAVNITPSPGTLLPQAFADSPSMEALKIEVSPTAVLVEGQVVATLEASVFGKSDIVSDGTSIALGLSLDKERRKQLLIAENNPSVKVDPKVVVIADQKIPYETIKRVLATAAINGYTDFKLAVIKGE